jgi:hypothetical protein
MKKEMYIDVLRRLRDVARRICPEEKNQNLVSPSLQWSSTPAGFDQGCLNKEQCEDTGASPILS